MFIEVESRDECELVSESDRKNSVGKVGMVDAGLYCCASQISGMLWEVKLQCEHAFKGLWHALFDLYDALENSVFELLDRGIIFIVEALSFDPFPDPFNEV